MGSEMCIRDSVIVPQPTIPHYCVFEAIFYYLSVYKISATVDLVPASIQSSQLPTTAVSLQPIGPHVIILVNDSQSLCSRCSYFALTSLQTSQQLLITAFSRQLSTISTCARLPSNYVKTIFPHSSFLGS